MRIDILGSLTGVVQRARVIPHASAAAARVVAEVTLREVIQILDAEIKSHDPQHPHVVGLKYARDKVFKFEGIKK